MSRYEKYRSLREGIKDLNSKNKTVDPIVEQKVEDADDFLEFLKKPGLAVLNVEKFEDTLEVAKTFDDIKNEPSPEIDRALKSAKKSLGEHEDTRLSILNKIKHPQEDVVMVDRDDKYLTQDFKKGMFINDGHQEVERRASCDEGTSHQSNQTVESKNENKRPKSLLERLEEMSPNEKKVKEPKEIQVMAKQNPETNAEKNLVDSRKNSPIVAVNTDKTIIVAKNEPIELDVHDEIGENSKGALILNVIIVILVLIFVALCVYIAMQIL